MDIEDPKLDLLKTARELGVAVVSYSPLGRGMLTGPYKSPNDFGPGDFRSIAPHFPKENFPENSRFEKIIAIAGRKKCTASQLTLAWLLAERPDIIPILG